jgi:hypothetical protein
MENEKPALDYAGKTLTTATPAHRVVPPDYMEWLPGALTAACCHPGEFALGLRDGTILFFDQATYLSGSEWIHVHMAIGLRNSPRGFVGGRGTDIRLTDVMWVADMGPGL